MRYGLVLIIVGFVFLSSCENSNSMDIEQNTIEWEKTNDNLYLRYYTNELSKAYSYQKYFDDTKYPVMDYFEAALIKKSGSPNAGSGFLFCIKDTDNYYRLLIADNHYYKVEKILNGGYYNILNYRTTSALKTDNISEDVVKVIKSGEDQFDIYFNNTFVTYFNDTSFEGGAYGFVAGIAKNEFEDFPNGYHESFYKYLYPKNIP